MLSKKTCTMSIWLPQEIQSLGTRTRCWITWGACRWSETYRWSSWGKKWVMLLLLLSGQRRQAIHLLDVHNMSSFSRATFRLGEPLKQLPPGKYFLKELTFKGYAPDRRLGVVTVLKEYLKWTLRIRRMVQHLILTCKKPIKRASRDTILQWTRAVFTWGWDWSEHVYTQLHERGSN